MLEQVCEEETALKTLSGRWQVHTSAVMGLPRNTSTNSESMEGKLQGVRELLRRSFREGLLVTSPVLLFSGVAATFQDKIPVSRYMIGVGSSNFIIASLFFGKLSSMLL